MADNLAEYEAFNLLTDSLARAVDGAKRVAESRPDQRDAWLQVAQSLDITKQIAYRLAAEGVRQ